MNRYNKLKKVGIGAAVVAAGALLTGVAFAGPGMGDGGKDRFDRAEKILQFDVNRDGKLDTVEREKMAAEFQAKKAERKAEHQARHAEMLKKFDTNADGKLDDAERAKVREEKRTLMFQELDTNKDGALSLAEFQAADFKKGKRHGRFHGFRGMGR